MKRGMTLSLCALLIGSGCAEPSPLPERTLTRALALVDTLPTLPWNGKSARAWRQGVVVVARELDPLYAAVWTGTEIVVNTHTLALAYTDITDVAGYIAHELRHVDGIGHDCNAHQDHRATAWSAYAVHVWALEQFGSRDKARAVEGGFCD